MPEHEWKPEDHCDRCDRTGFESTCSAGTVEDSHAKLAAEMLAPPIVQSKHCVSVETAKRWAARVEQLGARLSKALAAHDDEFRQRRILEEQNAEREAREAEIAKVRAEIVGHASGVDPEKCSAFQEHTRRICLEWAARLGGAT